MNRNILPAAELKYSAPAESKPQHTIGATFAFPADFTLGARTLNARLQTDCKMPQSRFPDAISLVCKRKAQPDRRLTSPTQRLRGYQNAAGISSATLADCGAIAAVGLFFDYLSRP